MSVKQFLNFKNLDVQYLGPSLEIKHCPTVIYFALSASDSLHLDPYNQPAQILKEEGFRVISMTLPGHGGNLDKYHAMQYWADHLIELEEFIQDAKEFVSDISSKSGPIATMGLSRGGFIATHLAALPFVRAVLGFAPVTHLLALSEFQNTTVPNRLSLNHLVNHLHHVKVRYYIGNRDERVSTQKAFNFITELADSAYQDRIKSMNAELFITPSTGHLGHGTLPHIFKEGAIWLKKQIVQ